MQNLLYPPSRRSFAGRERAKECETSALAIIYKKHDDVRQRPNKDYSISVTKILTDRRPS